MVDVSMKIKNREQVKEEIKKDTFKMLERLEKIPDKVFEHFEVYQSYFTELTIRRKTSMQDIDFSIKKMEEAFNAAPRFKGSRIPFSGCVCIDFECGVYRPRLDIICEYGEEDKHKKTIDERFKEEV
mgnify:CR=1 FL=1|tara:strand:- start:548 stop:928 length:381 start_codon:yes stop_codon:yes gene_type:complete